MMQTRGLQQWDQPPALSIPVSLLVYKSKPRGLTGWVQEVINASLWEGVAPAVLKEAVVQPFLKEPSLDLMDLDNYRPVTTAPTFPREGT